jgi:tetratricopeptide (TPR) repeat protein
VTRRRLLLAVVLLCAVVRVVHLVAIQRSPVFVAHRIWPATDMYAFDQWAQRIVGGDSLGREPYHPLMEWMLQAAPPAQWGRWLGDAPVFFRAPLYAYLLALVRWLFGDPALPMAVLQIVAAMASTAVLFLLTERLFGLAAAAGAASLLAVYGPAVHYDTVLLRGPWVVLLSLLISWRLLGLRERLTASGAAIVGALVGVSVLLNEGFAPLPWIVPVLVACWAPSVTRGAAAVGWFLGGLALALAPLVARNLAVGVPALQLATTGAFVFAFSNASDSDPIFFGSPPPSFIALMEAAAGQLSRLVWLCLRSFDGVGDAAGFYLRRAGGLIAPFENADNASFYYAAIQSPLLGWLVDWTWLFPLVALGIVLAVRHPRRGGLVALLPATLALLAANLVAPPLSRYRLPLIVLWMPCGGLAIDRLWTCLRQGRVAAVGGILAALLGVALVADQVERRVVLRGDDAWTHVHRMADFVVAAREYENQGRYREASREYLTFAARVPQDSRQWAHALYLAAPLQLRAGEAEAGRASADAAAERAPPDPGVLIAIGDLYLQTFGDVGAAAGVYRRAAALGPTGPMSQVLEDRLRRVEALER